MTKINNLISLATVDEQIREIESSQGDLPSRIKKLELEKSELEQNTKDLNDKIDDLNKKQSSLNITKEDSSTKLAKFKDQLYLVKNNKEYDAINSEIDTAKDNIFQISEELSKIEDDKKDTEEKIKLCQSENEEYVQKLDKYSTQLKDSMSSNEKEYANLKKHREELISGLDASILKEYNRMFAAKGYGACSSLGEACGSCYTSFPPQLISELRENLDFKYCPSCSILVYLEQ